MKDIQKFNQLVKNAEESVNEEEKKTLSIRLSATAIEKIEKRVDKLKKEKKLPRKYTVSSYISKMVDSFAIDSLNDKGDLGSV